jgi:hypothetical protein
MRVHGFVAAIAALAFGLPNASRATSLGEVVNFDVSPDSFADLAAAPAAMREIHELSTLFAIRRLAPRDGLDALIAEHLRSLAAEAGGVAAAGEETWAAFLVVEWEVVFTELRDILLAGGVTGQSELPVATTELIEAIARAGMPRPHAGSSGADTRTFRDFKDCLVAASEGRSFLDRSLSGLDCLGDFVKGVRSIVSG